MIEATSTLSWKPCSAPPKHEDIVLVVDSGGALFVATHDGDNFVELAYGPRQIIPDPALWSDVDVPDVTSS
ncbi:MAG TPA: hypothetical protein VFU02_17180 [Polyangiaceae bacterium]|nr:hypothetical protein [Polyangiaceae bacterium]